MTLEQIQKEVNEALKNKNKLLVETLRPVVAAIKKTAIDKRVEITEQLVNEVLLKELKTMDEMIETCPKERQETLDLYNQKRNIIAELAPKLITDEAAVRSMVADILAEAGIEPANGKPQIMKTVMPKLKGKVDMKIANKVIGELI